MKKEFIEKKFTMVIINSSIYYKHSKVLFLLPKIYFEFYEISLNFIKRMTYLGELYLIECVSKILCIYVLCMHTIKEECVNNPVLCCMYNFV